MRILVVSQYYYPEPFRIHDICEELVARGNQVDVLTGAPNYPGGDIYTGYKNRYYKEIINGVEVYRCKIHPRHKGNIHLLLNYLSFYRNAKYYVKKLANKKYDCIYVYQLSPIFSAIPALRISNKNNTPILLYCLDIWPESICGKINKKSILFNYIKNKSKNIYNCTNKILVTSPSFIYYLRDLGVTTDLSFLPQHSSDIYELSFNRGGLNQYYNFMFVGNVGSSQNLSFIINALSKVSNRNFVFHIVGDGSEFENIKKEIKQLNLENFCILHGRQPKSKLSEFYKIADVCVLSLKNEGAVSNTIPGKLQEYMSAGKFIIASINGDAGDLIKEVGCGLVSTCDDEETFILNIERILSNEIDIYNRGLRGRDYFINNFTLSKHVDELEKELRKMVKK